MIELRDTLAAQQALELRQPPIERTDIRPLVRVARHYGRKRQRFTAQIAALAKCRVCALDERTAALRLDEDPCPARPVFEPRIAFARARRQRFDPVGQRLRATLARPLERMFMN